MSLICVAALPLLAGCRTADEGADAEVVATTTQVADITRNVTGDEAEVHGILPPNADPHDYEPRPSDATAIAGADLVITSGGEVDEWVDELIESSGTDAEVVTLLATAPYVRRDDDGEADPHWWQDPRNAIGAARLIRKKLTEADPGGASEYEANAAQYVEEIRALDREIADCINFVPRADRDLVTSHDSLGYFAAHYEIDVVGTAFPALSTQAQPSSGETADLIEQIQARDVQAVFPESGLASELEEAIAEDAGAEIGGPLYADSLGERGSTGDTYLGALRANAQALYESFSGGGHQLCPEAE